MSRLTRRPFLIGGLGLAAAGVAGLGGSAAVCAGPTVGAGRLAFAFPILVRLPDPEAVGRDWLLQEPRGAVLSALRSDTDLARAALLPDGPAQEMLERRIRADFARRDTVISGNWIVTRLEARLAASLIPG